MTAALASSMRAPISKFFASLAACFPTTSRSFSSPRPKAKESFRDFQRHRGRVVAERTQPRSEKRKKRARARSGCRTSLASSGMAEADTVAPAHTKLASSDVSARLQQVLALLFPSNLAAKAALFAVVVALLPLLPSSQAPRIWELPHLLLLGIIVSYGVFGQKNADAEVAAKPVDDEKSVEAYVSEMMQGSFAFEQNDREADTDEDGAAKDGDQAWSSQYLPDDPLVVVADNVSNDGKGDAGDKTLHLPVRKLKPADQVPATLTGDLSDGIEEAEMEELRELLAPKAGYDDDIVRERAIPSPSSVLDADLTLSPSSPPLLPPPPPPPPPPFLGRGRRLQNAKARSFSEFGRSMSGRRLGLLESAGNKQRFRSKSAVHATRTPAASIGYDEAADDDGELDEMVAGAASDSSFSSDDILTDDKDKEEDSYVEEEEDDDGNSCDAELFELATGLGPEADEVEDEVDRKAEEFIAKFRDQIRMQRVEPARR